MADDKNRELIRLCRGIFETRNLIGTDFDDVQVLKVDGRDFHQQPGGGGLHISFSVSWHALGKTGREAHEALGAFIPPDASE